MRYDNVILKTALKTLLITVLSIAIIFLSTGLIAPQVIGDFTYMIGLTNVSVPYARAEYNNTHDINDLSALIDRAYQAKDYQTVVEYAPQMYAHEHFEGYVEYEYEERDTDYIEYVSGIYVLSLLNIGDSDTATDIVTRYTSLSLDNEQVKFTNVIKYLVVGIDKYQPSIDKRGDMYAFINELQVRVNTITDASLKNDFNLDYQVIFKQLRGE